MIDLDKIAQDLLKNGDVLEAEIVIKKQIDNGIEVNVTTINFTKNDYQWSSNSKRLFLKTKD